MILALAGYIKDMANPVQLFHMSRELQRDMQGVPTIHFGERLLVALVRATRCDATRKSSASVFRATGTGALLGAGGLPTLPLVEINRLYSEVRVVAHAQPQLSEAEIARDILVIWGIVDTRENAHSIIHSDTADAALVRWIARHSSSQLKQWTRDIAAKPNMGKIGSMLMLIWRVRKLSIRKKATAGWTRKVPLLGIAAGGFRAGQAMYIWHREVAEWYTKNPPQWTPPLSKTVSNPADAISDAALRGLDDAPDNPPL